MAMATKIGIMHSGSNNGKHDDHIQAFKDGLKWAAGANATILGPHYTDDKPANLDSIAHNFVTTDKVDVLVAAGGSRSPSTTSISRPRCSPAPTT
jgi:hypothetical protein